MLLTDANDAVDYNADLLDEAKKENEKLSQEKEMLRQEA